MKKAITETQKDFENSSSRIPEYLAWYRLFKREFTAFLKERGITEISFGKPNHFDMSGFFRKENQAYYFSIGDLRGFKDDMLIRTAKDFKDYTGGTNQSILLKSVETFTDGFNRIA